MSAHRSKKYEQYYGEAYTMKTTMEVKVCKKCRRKQSLKALHCSYCGGSLTTITVKAVEVQTKS